MKNKIKFILIVLFIQSCISSKNHPSETNSWQNEKGQEISQNEFRNKWGKDDGFARWDKVEDSKRIATLSKPVYETFKGSYQDFHTILENLSDKNYNKNTIFLIDYVYKDDLCSSKYSNNWSKTTTKERKRFLDSQKVEIEKKYDNVVVLHLFQVGISFAPIGSETYFYTDKGNQILNKLFQKPALCGSYAIINPNGNILVRNGEYRLDWMSELIAPEVWNTIFTQN